ncbi:MAG: hypothetical protein ACR2OJ_14890 [Hyphomicrobiales bacterium]
MSAYYLEFTNDRFLRDFSHDLSDLEFFKYTIGTLGFPPSFPLFSNDGVLAYDADDGVIAWSPVVTGSAVLSTLEPANVRYVPLPAALLLFLSAIGGMLGITKLKTRQN